MKYIHSLHVGDYSRDGHNQSENFIFRCSHDSDDIKKAYQEFGKKYGITLSGDDGILSEYEEGYISEEQTDDLRAAGINIDSTEGIYPNEGGVDDTATSFSPEGVARLYMEMVRVCLPGFTYELVEPPEQLNDDFIGYGVFS